MKWKLSNSVPSLLLIVGISNYSKVNADQNNIKKSLLTRFCFATLKSKMDKKDFKRIAGFTCECFNKKFNSGYSVKKSRLFCKEKASEKFNL